MIQTAQITEMPLAGMYEEKVYEGPHENDIWTWVKFEDEFYNDTYGQFRGKPVATALSPNNDYCYVLTDILLYEINRQNPDSYAICDYNSFGGTMRDITLTPEGILLIAGYYQIYSLEKPLCDIEGEVYNVVQSISSTLNGEVDYIQFKHWDKHILHIEAVNFYSSEKKVFLTYNAETKMLAYILMPKREDNL